MKKILLVAAMTALSTAAFAQTSPNTRQAPADSTMAPVPSYQAGSGQESGGYAKELNRGATAPGGVVVAPGAASSTVVVPNAPATTGTVLGTDSEPNARQKPQQGNNPNVPVYQSGSGQESGGPAKELNRN